MDLNLKAFMEFNSVNTSGLKDRDFFRATKYDLIDISEPLMIVFNRLDTYYFAYALQNRRVQMNNGEIADIQELLIAKTSLNTVIDLLEKKIDINQSLLINKNEVYRVGKISSRTFPLKKVDDFKEVEDKIPLPGVNLDEKIPNKINVEKTLRLLKQELNYQANYTLSTSTVDKKIDVNIINNKLRKIASDFLRRDMKTVKYEVEA